jgi:hypothetical protein
VNGKPSVVALCCVTGLLGGLATPRQPWHYGLWSERSPTGARAPMSPGRPARRPRRRFRSRRRSSCHDGPPEHLTGRARQGTSALGRARPVAVQGRQHLAHARELRAARGFRRRMSGQQSRVLHAGGLLRVGEAQLARRTRPQRGSSATATARNDAVDNRLGRRGDRARRPARGHGLTATRWPPASPKHPPSRRRGPTPTSGAAPL